MRFTTPDTGLLKCRRARVTVAATSFPHPRKFGPESVEIVKSYIAPAADNCAPARAVLDQVCVNFTSTLINGDWFKKLDH